MVGKNCFAHLPEEMRTLDQWVNWRLEENNSGKPTKVPYTPGDRHASTTDPATWSTFSEVIEAADEPFAGYDGIGFVLTPDDPYTIVDFDHAIVDEVVDPQILGIVERMDSYTEISQSGTGIHVVVNADKPGPRCKSSNLPNVEIYNAGRYVALTGNLLPGAPTQINERQEALDALYNEAFGDPQASSQPTKSAYPIVSAADITDDELIAEALNAKNCEKFVKLWNGDTSDYGGDDSAADMALCCILAFRTNGDSTRIDRLFRKSGLMRPKWDEIHGLQTYGQLTITKAVEFMTGTNPSASPSVGEIDTSGDLLIPDEMYTQLSFARQIVALYGDIIRFNVDTKGFIVFDKRWAEDKTGKVRRMAISILDSMYNEYKSLTNKDEAKAFLAHIRRSQKDSEINGALNLVKNAVSDTIPVVQEAFDQSPMLFNCPNGTIDLTTCSLRPHDPADMLSKTSNVVYDALAQCARWNQFLGEVFTDEDGNPDLETIKYIQRLCGYFLTGLVCEQKFWILHGKGSAGKGRFCQALNDVLGEYSAPVLRSAILQKPSGGSGADNQNLIDVTGNRVIHCSEFEKHDHLDRGIVKAISGEDTLKMRRHNEHAYSYQPEYKLLLLTNTIPAFDGAESGMKRRVVIIPFRAKFYEPEECLSPVADKDIGKKLKAESSGILNWMLEGLREYLQLGGFGPTPAAIKAASAEVLNDQDILSDWLETCCNEGSKYSTSLKELWAHLKGWCESNGQQPSFKDSRGLSKSLVSRDGIRKADHRASDGSTLLNGIALKQPSSSFSEGAATIENDDYDPFTVDGTSQQQSTETDISLNTPNHGDSFMDANLNPQQVDDIIRDFSEGMENLFDYNSNDTGSD